MSTGSVTRRATTRARPLASPIVASLLLVACGCSAPALAPLSADAAAAKPQDEVLSGAATAPGELNSDPTTETSLVIEPMDSEDRKRLEQAAIRGASLARYNTMTESLWRVLAGRGAPSDKGKYETSEEYAVRVAKARNKYLESIGGVHRFAISVWATFPTSLNGGTISVGRTSDYDADAGVLSFKIGAPRVTLNAPGVGRITRRAVLAGYDAGPQFTRQGWLYMVLLENYSEFVRHNPSLGPTDGSDSFVYRVKVAPSEAEDLERVEVHIGVEFDPDPVLVDFVEIPWVEAGQYWASHANYVVGRLREIVIYHPGSKKVLGVFVAPSKASPKSNVPAVPQ